MTLRLANLGRRCVCSARGLHSIVAGAAIAVLALGPSGLLADAAHATTLHGALRQSYDFSPVLKSQRAALRASDEGVSQAVAGYRPQVSASGDYGVEFSESRFNDPSVDFSTGEQTFGSSSTTRPFGYTLTLEQPIFQGKGLVNSVRQAEANVGASRELLRDTENTVLLNAVTAYMNVIQDRALVRLQQNNLRVLDRELRATRDRFSVGEVTRTDVAQAEARSALARSNLDAANANLRSSRAAYRQVIGVDPINLAEPQVPGKLLPHSLQEAINISLAENPEITQAVFNEASARFAVAVADAAFAPNVSLNAQYTQRFNPSDSISASETALLQGRVTVPLYTGGRLSSQSRQARQTALQQRQLIETQRVNARAATIAAWSSLTSARAQLISDGEQVRASRTALTGVREEERVGQRTLLDVLDAEQELLDAQVSLAVTQRNLIVAAYAVLAAIGRLDVSTLHLSITPYDPEEYNKLVESKKIGIRTERDASHDADVKIVGGIPAFEVTVEPAPDAWETRVEAHVEVPRNETAPGTGPTNDVFGLER